MKKQLLRVISLLLALSAITIIISSCKLKSAENGSSSNINGELFSEPSVWVASALTDIFSDTVVPENALNKAEFGMAKNEYEGFFVAVRSGIASLSNLSVSVEPFKEQNAPIITVSATRFANCSQSSLYIEKRYMRGSSPNSFPEYFENTPSLGDLKPFQSGSFFVEAYASENTAPGIYNSTITIKSDAGTTATMPLAITVYNVLLPEPKNSSFDYCNWTDFGISMSKSQIDEMYDIVYNVKTFDDNYWKLLANFAKVMKKQRQNGVHIPLDRLIMKDLKIGTNGEYIINWDLLDKYCQTFIDNGSISFFECIPLMDKDWYIAPEPKSYPTNAVDAWIFYMDKDNTIKQKWVFSDTADAAKHFNDLLPKLYSHLKQKGWDKMWVQHVSDECDAEVQIKQIKVVYDLIHKLMPGVRTKDCGREMLSYGNSIDIPTPQLDTYDRSREDYRKAIAEGKKLSFYTCVNPQKDYMSRIGDFPLLSTRAIGWYAYKENISGYIHYAWQMWFNATYPNQPAKDMYMTDAPADAWIVYPDAKNLSVFEGPRAIAVRDGWEDMEIFKLAEKKDTTKVRKLVDDLVKWGNRFERDPAKYFSARTEILKLFA